MSHFRQRLASSFSGGRGGGVGSLQPGTIVSSRSTGGSSRTTRAETRALDIQRQQDAARNAQIRQTLKRQRQRSAKLMKKSRQSLKRSGKAARRDIRERGTKFMGAGEQDLVSRGLGNTTVRAGFRRGVRADVSRNLTRQRGQEGQRLSDLFSREAGMTIPEGSLGLQGVGMQSGGLQDYLKLMIMLRGGLS